MAAAAEQIHATCIALSGRGVLLTGPSGAGKSDLALRCLALGPPLLPASPRLVADDRVQLQLEAGRLIASAPPTIAGLLEVRGLGILTFETAARCEVVMVADLTPNQSVERLPDRMLTVAMMGLNLPLLRMKPFEASAALKLLLALDKGGVATVP